MGYSDWTYGSNSEKSAFGVLSTSEATIAGSFDSIPVLDVSGIFSSNIQDRLHVASQLRDACMRVGFFYIENHGIPQELVDEAFEWGKKFFALGFEEKMEVYIDNAPNFRGYTPLYGSGIPDEEGRGNGNEAFDFGHDDKLNDDPGDTWLDPHMRGSNQWPRQLPVFETCFSEYYRRLRAFCRILTRSVALSLGLPEEYFQKYITHPGCSAVIMHYPPQEPGNNDAKGLDAHTDSEFFTVLAPGAVRALEILNRDGQWISAPQRPGCFIVNVGDQLQAWTNDLYVSTRHRVMNFSGEERYSIPFFFSANYETVIEPMPGLMKDGHVAKHSPLTAGKMYKDVMIAFHRIAASNPELKKYRKPIEPI